jgi:polyisoprenyl-phosphate glycosyltransferase
MKTVDLIIPVFNEQEILQDFHQLLCDEIIALDYAFKITYINDGSTDQTTEHLERISTQDSRVEVLELSRNFGHQSALCAGLDQSTADYVVTMDGDGQHPPALIKEMLALAENGYDLVLSQRVEPGNAQTFKNWSSTTFYNLINKIGDTKILSGGADFRLMSRPVVESLRKMPEYHRFLRGMVAWVGYRSVVIPFTPPKRLGGKSKYSLKKMLRLGADAVFSFSLVPLYASISLGIVFLFLAILEAFYVLSFWISGNTARLAPGWSSLMFMLLIVGGVIMISLGIMGIYVGYIFQEVKHRPVYIIRRIISGGSSPKS